MSAVLEFSDPLVSLIDPASQRAGVALAQDVFGQLFRQAVDAETNDNEAALTLGLQAIHAWVDEGSDPSAQAARLALLIYALDAWGLAYTQAFRLQAIPPLSALMGNLRTPLETQAEARFTQYFAALSTQESAAIDGKIALRRNIHLALWHAMAACTNAQEARPITQVLGSLMLALDTQMPEYGWRLLADSMATLQIALLEHGEAGGAQDGTRELFAALQHALPAERYQAALSLSGQALLAWLQTRRG
ncbi:hypothetical protein [Azonexus sp.]|uniref:hypothetical protein n=1 Tax=Azonexus sp. TaxID=1872668 RepID=UPI0039E67E5F